jgi:hypothetical protein
MYEHGFVDKHVNAATKYNVAPNAKRTSASPIKVEIPGFEGTGSSSSSASAEVICSDYARATNCCFNINLLRCLHA